MTLALDRFAAAARAHGYKVPSGRDAWRMPCPGHHGSGDNLSVRQGDRGVTLYCHSHGCDASDIASAIGLTVGDLFDGEPSAPRPRDESPWRTVAVFPYTDEADRVLFEVVRQERGERLPGVKPEKRFQQRKIDASGEMVYKLNGARRVLFRLPRVLEAVAEERVVLVVEGEQAVLAAERLGFVATTAPMGAGAWVKDGADPHDYAAPLRGAAAVLLPDNDEPGRRHMHDVGRVLSSVATSVRVLELPGLPPKGDIADFEADGGSAMRLAALLEEARPFEEWRQSMTLGAATETDPPAPEEGELPLPKLLSDVSGSIDITWTVEELLVAREPAWIGGVDGALKSTFVLHIACAVAGGYRVAGRFQATRGPVLVISGEDPEEIIRNRVEALCRGHGWSARDILASIHVLALAGTDLRDAKWQAHLLRLTAAIKPALIVFDPYFDLVSGDENSNSDGKVVNRMLRALTLPSSATVLMVHHFKKAAEGVSKSDMFRGASAPVRASRQTYAIEKGPDDDVLIVTGVKFSRGRLKGSVREKFALRTTIVADDENEAMWHSARFDFVSAVQARFDAAEKFVLESLAAGARLSTTDLKTLAHGTGTSGADIARALRSLEARRLIDFEPGERGAKLWGLTLPSDSGQGGQGQNDLAGQGASLPGSLFSAALTLPAPFRGQGGKVRAADVGQGQEVAS